MPERIQRRRVKGWRIPKGAIYCGRPGPLGNPFVDTPHGVYAGPTAILFHVKIAENAAEAYRLWLAAELLQAEALPFLRERRDNILRLIPDLRGKDLVCWCALGAEFCHVDVLLEIANA